MLLHVTGDACMREPELHFRSYDSLTGSHAMGRKTVLVWTRIATVIE